MSQIFGLEDIGGKQADGDSERNGKLQPNILGATMIKDVLTAEKSCSARVSIRREMITTNNSNASCGDECMARACGLDKRFPPGMRYVRR